MLTSNKENATQWYVEEVERGQSWWTNARRLRAALPNPSICFWPDPGLWTYAPAQSIGKHLTDVTAIILAQEQASARLGELGPYCGVHAKGYRGILLKKG